MPGETNFYTTINREHLSDYQDAAKRLGHVTVREATRGQQLIHADPATANVHITGRFDHARGLQDFESTVSQVRGEKREATMLQQASQVYGAIKANPQLSDSLGFGGEKGKNAVTASVHIHAESGRNNDRQWEDRLSVMPLGADDTGVRLIRSYDLTNGGDEDEGHYRLQRFEPVQDPTTGEQVQQVTEYALDPSLAANEVRTAFVRTGDSPTAPLEMSATDFAAQVNAITTELQQGIHQLQPVEAVAQAA